MTARTRAPGADAATVLLPAASSPLITFRIQFRVGAIDEPAGFEGLNALTALSIAGGGTGELSYERILDRLDPMAAAIVAQPDREVTTFVGEVHRDHLEEFRRLLLGLVLRPRFDAADVARNRDLLLAALRTHLRSSDDEALGKEVLNAMVHEGHPYGRPIAGSARGLTRAGVEEVRAFYERNYTLGRVTLALAGGYPETLPAALLDELRALPAGSLPGHGPGDAAPRAQGPSNAPPRALPAPAPVQGLRIRIAQKPTPTTALSIGHPLPLTRADPDYYALLVANSYLGEHRTMNGRLMNALRVARGLNYGDYSYIERFDQDGGSTFPLPNTPQRQAMFSVWVRPVARVNAPFALRAVVRELARLVDAGLTPEEFEATRRYLLNYSRLWTQSLSRRLGYLLDSRFYGMPPFVDRIQEALPGLTVAAVNAAVRRHIHPADLAVAMVTDDAAGLKRILASGEPTPIVYQTPTTDPALLAGDAAIESFPLPIAADRIEIVDAAGLFEE